MKYSRESTCSSSSVFIKFIVPGLAFLLIPLVCMASGRASKPHPDFQGIAETNGAFYLWTDPGWGVNDVRLYKSVDGGAHWKKLALQLHQEDDIAVRDITVGENGSVYVLGADGTVFRVSLKNGTVKKSHIGVFNTSFRRIWCLSNGWVVALRSSLADALGTIFLSKDHGRTWQTKFNASSKDWYGLYFQNSHPCILKEVYVGLPKHNIKLFSSNDWGETWSKKGAFPFDTVPNHKDVALNTFSVRGDTIIFGGSNDAEAFGMVYWSSDAGKEWHSYQVVPENASREYPEVEDLLVLKKGILVLLTDAILYKTNVGIHWRQVAVHYKPFGLGRLFEDSNGRIWAIGGKVLISSDGIKWKECAIFR